MRAMNPAGGNIVPPMLFTSETDGTHFDNIEGLNVLLILCYFCRSPLSGVYNSDPFLNDGKRLI
jgi:hypothetical protein